MRIFLLFALIFAAGCAAFAYSRTLPHMTDQAGFDAEYSKMIDAYYAPQPETNDTLDSDAHHERENHFDEVYQKLFKAHVTPRNTIKKFSLCAIVLGAGGMLLFIRGVRGLVTPPSRWVIPLIGLFALFVTDWGTFRDTEEFYGRGEWATWDEWAPSIPMVVVSWSVVLIVIILCNSLLLLGRCMKGSTPVFAVKPRYLNWFILAELALLIVLTAEAVKDAQYFGLLATPFWFYFYLSVLAVRARGFERAAETPAP